MKKLLIAFSLIISASTFGNHDKGHVDVIVNDLTPNAAAGQLKFNDNCAACHGINAQGSILGPPLIHDIYNPGHHSDKSFISAVLNGVQQHHWRYGNMPPQPQVGFADMSNILAFIREVQQQNGIYLKEHKM